MLNCTTIVDLIKIILNRVRELLITHLRNHRTYTQTIQHTVLPVALTYLLT